MNTNHTQNTNKPSLLISKIQDEVRQNLSNDENAFGNLFPSVNGIFNGIISRRRIDYSNLHWKMSKNRVAAKILTPH